MKSGIYRVAGAMSWRNVLAWIAFFLSSACGGTAALGLEFKGDSGVAGDAENALDAGRSSEAAAGDVTSGDPSSSYWDATSDVAGDVVEPRDVVDLVDGGEGNCTPLAFPVQLPSSCTWSVGSITAPGSVWGIQPCSSPPGFCSPQGVSAGAATACERCAETFRCSCLATSGQTGECKDTDAGPLLVLCQ